MAKAIIGANWPFLSNVTSPLQSSFYPKHTREIYINNVSLLYNSYTEMHHVTGFADL